MQEVYSSPQPLASCLLHLASTFSLPASRLLKLTVIISFLIRNLATSKAVQQHISATSMEVDKFKVTIHMVSSLDGYIAKKDNSVSWFETPDNYEKGVHVTEQETAEFLREIDCYIMGANTYEHALKLSKDYGWVYGDVPTIVLTHRKLPIERQNIEIYSGDLVKLVNERLKPRYKNVWLVGGAKLTKDFIRLNLADEIRLSILPVILGNGTPFFDQIEQEHALHLKDVTAYKSGMVGLCYEIRK